MVESIYEGGQPKGSSSSSSPSSTSRAYPNNHVHVPPTYEESDDHGRRNSFIQRIIDSFKRDPNAYVSKHVGADGKVFDLEGAAAATAASPLHRRLKGRHLQMIAIGGSIGEIMTTWSGCRRRSD